MCGPYWPMILLLWRRNNKARCVLGHERSFVRRDLVKYDEWSFGQSVLTDIQEGLQQDTPAVMNDILKMFPNIICHVHPQLNLLQNFIMIWLILCYMTNKHFARLTSYLTSAACQSHSQKCLVLNNH